MSLPQMYSYLLRKNHKQETPEQKKRRVQARKKYMDSWHMRMGHLQQTQNEIMGRRTA